MRTGADLRDVLAVLALCAGLAAGCSESDAPGVDGGATGGDTQANNVDAGSGRADAGAPISDAEAGGVAPSTPAPGSSAPWLIHSGDSVFFVGNSFFGGDDNRLADLVTALGHQLSPAFDIRTGQHVVYGNQPLSWFLQQPESQDAISSKRYKVFVLQGEEREPVDHPDDFKQAVRDYHRAVTENGGRIMLFMTWDFIWERDSSFFKDLSTAYEDLGRELDVPVIPVGLIYDDCNKQPYGDEQPYWLTSQQLHQNDEGTIVNVYATFSMLTGIDPMGTLFTIPYADPVQPPDMYRYLSEKSWARVAPRLRGAQ